MNKLAPIILFVYARPIHTKRMIESLIENKQAKESDLYIFSDSAKKDKDKENVEQVREVIRYIQQQHYFKSVKIIESKENKGLAKSVIEGVNEIINKNNKVIVLEDDLIVSNTFLEYMNNALGFYENEENIWSISGYNLPIEIPSDYNKDVYLGYRGCSWGWATWKDRWNRVDWNVKDYAKFKHNYKSRKRFNFGGPDMSQMLDAQMEGKINSWAIRWCYEQAKENKYTIYPVKSLVTNQGLDGSGTHSEKTNEFDSKAVNYIPKLERDLKINHEISTAFYNKFNAGFKQKIMELCVILRIDKLVKGLKKR